MSLRAQVLRGGVYLSLRQALSTGISLGGVVALTRILGPAEYGVFAAGLGIFIYLQNVALWGVDVFLVRREGDESPEVYHQAHSVLLLLSAAGVLLGLAALPALAAWNRVGGVAPVTGALVLALPLAVLAKVPLARLERALDYRRVALVELAAQVAYYAVALSLALLGRGVWAAVAGWWAQLALSLVLLYRAAAYRPRLRWDAPLAREMLGYGVGYSASVWVWQLRTLVNPLVVGPSAGASAMGYVALAIRVVEVMSFVRSATWRISIAAFARLRDDRPRLLAALTEGAHLQVLALGPLVVAFAWVAPLVLPAVFGPDWLPVLVVYPFVALSYLVNAMFSLHSSVLYVLRRNWAVTAFHLAHVLLFAGAAAVFVPRVGIVGYGYAEAVALVSYGVIHTCVAALGEAPRYGAAGLWCAAFGLALFARDLGWWSLAGLVVMALSPATRLTVRRYATGFLGARHAG